jgi:Uma2 family endonuclease
MVAPVSIMTTTEFEEFIARPENADRLFELINGEIVEKMPNPLHGLLASLLNAEIYIYLKSHPIGQVMVEVRHQLPDEKHHAYLPDVSFISHERALAINLESTVPTMPDLAIEIASPNDSPLAMREKALYYLKHGAKLVWLLFPRKKQIEVHTSESVHTLNLEDILDGGDVLPDFNLPLKDIFKY